MKKIIQLAIILSIATPLLLQAGIVSDVVEGATNAAEEAVSGATHVATSAVEGAAHVAEDVVNAPEHIVSRTQSNPAYVEEDEDVMEFEPESNSHLSNEQFENPSIEGEDYGGNFPGATYPETEE